MRRNEAEIHITAALTYINTWVVCAALYGYK
jgi:hypothetical protein